MLHYMGSKNTCLLQEGSLYGSIMIFLLQEDTFYGSITTFLLQEGTLYMVNNDLSRTRKHVMRSITLSLTRIHTLLLLEYWQ